MKKLIAIFLCIIIMLSLIACESKEKDEDKNKSKEEYEENGDYYYAHEKETEKYYTVKFQTNGGNRIESKKIKDGGELKTSPTTTQEGYLFEGWFIDETFTTAAIFPISINNDITLYAKWLRLENKQTCKDTSIKSWKDESNTSYYYITPNGFDIDRLAELNYSMTITVTYTVRYEKDYDALWDIGYMGAPKYTASVTNQDDIGQIKKDLKAPDETTSQTITYKRSVADLKNEQIKLKFSTENIQNTIYFENIVITYICE